MTTPEEPASKRKCLDFNLCLLCQEKKLVKTTVLEKLTTPLRDTYETFLRTVTLRSTYRNPTYVAINQRLQGLSADDLTSRCALWHWSCYSIPTHKQHNERDKGWYEGATSQTDTHILTGGKKRGRPSTAIPGEPSSSALTEHRRSDKVILTTISTEPVLFLSVCKTRPKNRDNREALRV